MPHVYAHIVVVGHNGAHFPTTWHWHISFNIGKEKQSKKHNGSTAFNLITYEEKQVVIYTLNKLGKKLLTVLDGESAVQPAVVAPDVTGTQLVSHRVKVRRATGPFVM